MVVPLIIGGIELLDILLAGTVAGAAGIATHQALKNSTKHSPYGGNALTGLSGETLNQSASSNLSDTQDAFTAISPPSTLARASDDTKSRSRPMASTTERTEDNCNNCGPKAGSKERIKRTFKTGDGHWAEYQIQIANMGGYPHFAILGKNLVEEWKYRGTWFDGFWEFECTLVEAKHGYRTFLKRNDEGAWVPRTIVNSRGESLDFLAKGLMDFTTAATRQMLLLADNTPPTTLIWFFSDVEVWRYCNKVFHRQKLRVKCVWEPFYK